jgi:hypothetical protein
VRQCRVPVGRNRGRIIALLQRDVSPRSVSTCGSPHFLSRAEARSIVSPEIVAQATLRNPSLLETTFSNFACRSAAHLAFHTEVTQMKHPLRVRGLHVLPANLFCGSVPPTRRSRSDRGRGESDAVAVAGVGREGRRDRGSPSVSLQSPANESVALHASVVISSSAFDTDGDMTEHKLDVDTANREVMRWLNEVANPPSCNDG